MSGSHHLNGESHPSLETLAALLEGALENDRLRREIVPHLAAHCPACEEALREIERARHELGHWSERVAVVERQEAPALRRRLDLPFLEQLRAISEQEELQTWGLCALLLRESLELARAEPARPVGAAHAARLAVATSAALDPAYGPDALADLRALCLAALANSHRVLGETEAAGACFAEAHVVLDLGGTGDPRVSAEISVLEAALAYEQRRHSRALALYERALGHYGQITLGAWERRLPLEALAGQAAVLREAGQPRKALDLLRRALDHTVSPDRQPAPELHALLQRDLLLVLIELGHHAEAEALLAEDSRPPSELATPRDRLRLRGCAGLIARGLGREEDAERILLEVKEGLLDLSLGYDAAVVVLELASLYAESERHDDLVRLAELTVAPFQSRAVHREAMAALILFQHACQREKLTVPLARHLAAVLRQGRLHTLFNPSPAGFPGCRCSAELQAIQPEPPGQLGGQASPE